MHLSDHGFQAAWFSGSKVFRKIASFSCLDNSCLDEYHLGERIFFAHRNGKIA